MKSPSSTYYYHYDVHGNTLKVTDTNQDTKITYTYDTLGNITSQTNPDSIPNPFTFMGASQTILDTETGLYFSSGYYNPQTGTLLQGTGSPAMPNPTSISTINSMSTSSLPEEQLLSDAAASSSFAPPPGSEDGISHSGKQSGPPTLGNESASCISISGWSGGDSWENRSVLNNLKIDFSQDQDRLPDPPEQSNKFMEPDYFEGDDEGWYVDLSKIFVDPGYAMGYLLPEQVKMLIAASEYGRNNPDYKDTNLNYIIQLYWSILDRKRQGSKLEDWEQELLDQMDASALKAQFELEFAVWFKASNQFTNEDIYMLTAYKFKGGPPNVFFPDGNRARQQGNSYSLGVNWIEFTAKGIYKDGSFEYIATCYVNLIVTDGSTHFFAMNLVPYDGFGDKRQMWDSTITSGNWPDPGRPWEEYGYIHDSDNDDDNMFIICYTGGEAAGVWSTGGELLGNIKVPTDDMAKSRFLLGVLDPGNWSQSKNIRQVRCWMPFNGR